MTNRPELRLGSNLLPGLLAVGLFAIMALVALNTSFGGAAGFPDGVSITAAIGYALFDLGPLQAEQGVPETEPFLLAFLLVAVVLDAALDAALVLAKREEAGEPVATLSSASAGSARPASRSAAAADGGRPKADSNGGRDARTDGESRSTSDRGSAGGEGR